MATWCTFSRANHPPAFFLNADKEKEKQKKNPHTHTKRWWWENRSESIDNNGVPNDECVVLSVDAITLLLVMASRYLFILVSSFNFFSFFFLVCLVRSGVVSIVPIPKIGNCHIVYHPSTRRQLSIEHHIRVQKKRYSIRFFSIFRVENIPSGILDKHLLKMPRRHY